MKKKIIISITICLITFLTIFLIINNKKQKEKIENKNISIILETEEGNLESNSFPSKEEYEYSKVVCENTSNTITPTFNSDTWKLSLNVEEESIDGNFNCNIYFKEKIKTAADTIIAKATERNSEGLITLSQPQTGQTPAQTEYRYSGSNDVVKNYVNFNNETWRIIGVFPTEDASGNIENRVKIIREESIGNYSWDTSPAGVNDFIYNDEQYYGGGVNQWSESGTYEGADIMRLLNPGYESENINNSLYWNREGGTCYNGYHNATTTCNFSSTGLTSEAKQMVEDAKWYTASGTVTETTTAQSYEQERGNQTGIADVGITITKTTNWVGKIGLMYPSDYGYASHECYESEVFYRESGNDYRQETCTSTDWLYNGSVQWSLSPLSNNSRNVRLMSNFGNVGSNLAGVSYTVRPTLYLSSSVKITSGSGTIDDMYELSM